MHTGRPWQTWIFLHKKLRTIANRARWGGGGGNSGENPISLGALLGLDFWVIWVRFGSGGII